MSYSAAWAVGAAVGRWEGSALEPLQELAPPAGSLGVTLRVGLRGSRVRGGRVRGVCPGGGRECGEAGRECREAAGEGAGAPRQAVLGDGEGDVGDLVEEVLDSVHRDVPGRVLRGAAVRARAPRQV